MKKTLIIALVVVAGAANAQVVFYGGNQDGRDGIASQNGGAVTDAIAIDNFTLSANTTITGLFANMFCDATAFANGYTGNAGYAIYKSVSTSGATLVTSGTGAVTPGASQGTNLGNNVFRYTISGLNIALTAGTYWFGVQLAPTSGQSYTATTSGASGVGSPIADGNSYLIWPGGFGNSNPVPVADLEGGGKWDLSQGVLAAVPEPATMAALGLGVAALLRRRRK